MATDNRNAGTQSWPCQLSVWLPLPSNSVSLANNNFKALSAGKTTRAGNWLISKSKNNETISLEMMHGAQVLKLTAGDSELLSTTQLSSENFCFSLINEVLLLGSACSSTGIYTFSCRFICRQHAIECAASLKTAMSPARSMETMQLHQERASLEPNYRSTELVFLQAVSSDPEHAGRTWWNDFSKCMQEIERAWSSIEQTGAPSKY